MNEKLKRNLIGASVTAAAGAAVSALILWLRHYSVELPTAEQYRIISDALIIPGTLIAGIGFLVFVSGTGFFDGLGYVFAHTFSMLLPGHGKKEKSYFDYKQEKAEKRTGFIGVLFLPAVGVAFIAASVVFSVLFLQAA